MLRATECMVVHGRAFGVRSILDRRIEEDEEEGRRRMKQDERDSYLLSTEHGIQYIYIYHSPYLLRTLYIPTYSVLHSSVHTVL